MIAYISYINARSKGNTTISKNPHLDCNIYKTFPINESEVAVFSEPKTYSLDIKVLSLSVYVTSLSFIFSFLVTSVNFI